MSQPLLDELEKKAIALAARIQSRSADAILDMARKLVSTTDETLFGDTEFALRDLTHRILDHAYTEHLLEKKVGTRAPRSIAPTVKKPLVSKLTVRKRSKPSAGPSPAIEPTITAHSVAKDPAPGTLASD